MTTLGLMMTLTMRMISIVMILWMMICGHHDFVDDNWGPEVETE